LPSAPDRPIHVLAEADRPQPRLDRDREGGMAVSVGRVRADPVLGLKLELLVHNTIRGAAGAAVLNAELLHARGLLP
jgi:aspartate-semialdehyde dehydrogenase